MQVKLLDEAEAWRYDGGEAVEQRARWLRDEETVEALLLHALASACTGHTLDGVAAKFLASGEKIDELRCECTGAKNDELG